MFSEDSGQKEKPVFGVEEVNLADYLKKIDTTPILTREQEWDLAKKIRKGDEKALHTLVKANLRFVVSIAKQYVNQGLSLADLVNEGNLGLIKASYRFDETRGYKFISYAVWWIRQAMLLALAEQSRIVRLPMNRAGNVYRIGKAARQLDQEFGRNPSPDEIAQKLNLSVDKIDDTMKIANSHLSLEASSNNDEEEMEISPAVYEKKGDPGLMTDEMKKYFNYLTEREHSLLCLFCGLEGEEPHSLNELVPFFRLTAERLRQIKDKAILRLDIRSRYLKGGVED